MAADPLAIRCSGGCASRRRGRVALLAACVALVAAACSDRQTASVQDPDADITVFAASSLTGAFVEIVSAYEAEYPSTKVMLNFGASSELVTQINNGAPVDVYASADTSSMGGIETGTVGEPVVFATNRLQIIVQADNPKGIATLADLAKPDVLYVTASPDVPIGKYAQQALDAAGVTVTPRSLEANVKGIVSKVSLGEADAGIVYVTDVLAAGSRVAGIDIPTAVNVVAKYPIAIVAATRSTDSATRFVAFVRSATGRRILAEHGFGSP
jgi:molybdate transport system substrate-binding protein